jgi:hypothetical protein
MRVKPAPGLTVRDPFTKRLLTDEGIEVPDGSILWTKMLNDGDVYTEYSAPPVVTPFAGKSDDAEKGETS